MRRCCLRWTTPNPLLNVARIRQSRPDSGFGFKANALCSFCVVLFSAGVGASRCGAAAGVGQRPTFCLLSSLCGTCQTVTARVRLRLQGERPLFVLSWSVVGRRQGFEAAGGKWVHASALETLTCIAQVSGLRDAALLLASDNAELAHERQNLRRSLLSTKPGRICTRKRLISQPPGTKSAWFSQQ